MSKPAAPASPPPAIATTDGEKQPTLSQSAARFVVEQPLAVVGLGLLFGFALGRALTK